MRPEKTKRQEIVFTEKERNDFKLLPCFEGFAFRFWWKVAYLRGLDAETIIHDEIRNRTTALPIGHGKHWCHPIQLTCKSKPKEFVSDFA